MPKIAYVSHKFNTKARNIIILANHIINEYAKQGLVLTLRQLYYQFVSRDILPNTQKSYMNLAGIINNARLAGMIDWLSIIDMTRSLKQNGRWQSPEQIVKACADQYQKDRWEGQSYRVEVWIEKDALVGVIDGICREWDVPYFSCRGYTSQSEMWVAGERMKSYRYKRQEPIILHLGDHDPSGKDMTRDIQERLDLFVGPEYVDVRRIALNMDQIDKYNPPPNPAKLSDTRATEYIMNYGDSSWELDALEPLIIIDLIKDQIMDIIDLDLYNQVLDQESEDKNKLLSVANQLENDA